MRSVVPKRLRRRVVPWSLASVFAPAIATAWLLVSTGDPETVRSVNHRREPSTATSDVAPTSTLVAKPSAVAVLQHLADPSVTIEPSEARTAVADRSGTAGARILALRRLAVVSPEAAVTEAEALVFEATDDPQGRFLGVNALGVLARNPGGRASLLRCSEGAPTPALRSAARTLLARSR